MLSAEKLASWGLVSISTLASIIPITAPATPIPIALTCP